jgi:hypothetical protein
LSYLKQSKHSCSNSEFTWLIAYYIVFASV